MSKKINSRSKGKRGERDIAKMLEAWWGSKFTSTPMSGGFATKGFRDDWNASGDVVTPDLTFPFCVEVKWREGWDLLQVLKSTETSIPIWEWWDQTLRETPEGKIPFLVFKRNNQPWFFLTHADQAKNVKGMWLDDFQGRRIIIGLLEDFFSCQNPEKLKNP